MTMVITSLIVSPLLRWRCFLPSLNRDCWAFNSGKVPWQNSSQSTKSRTMSISVLLFVVGNFSANLSRFLPKKEFRDSTTELISLLCFNFYIELTLLMKTANLHAETARWKRRVPRARSPIYAQASDDREKLVLS